MNEILSYIKIIIVAIDVAVVFITVVFDLFLALCYIVPYSYPSVIFTTLLVSTDIQGHPGFYPFAHPTAPSDLHSLARAARWSQAQRRGWHQGCLECRNCGKQFNYSKNMVRHRRKCEGNFHLCCPDCGKGFNRRDKYNLHVAKHALAGRESRRMWCWRWGGGVIGTGEEGGGGVWLRGCIWRWWWWW